MRGHRDWFLSGLLLWLLIVVLSFLMQDISYIYTISGWIAMVGIVILGFLSVISSKEEHTNRKKMDRDYQETAKEGSGVSLKVFLFLLPHIVSSSMLIFILYL